VSEGTLLRGTKGKW